MSGFTPRHAVILVLLTLSWGLNWPVMKLGVSHFPPLSFRALSMWLGLPLLGLALLALRVPFGIPRTQWRELASLTFSNMLVWHVVAILAVQALSSGRAAILGYTMPIFSALWGRALFGQRLAPRQLAGVAAATLGVALLLWHEAASMAGRPWGAIGMLLAAATWAYGTQRLRGRGVERLEADLGAQPLPLLHRRVLVNRLGPGRRRNVDRCEEPVGARDEHPPPLEPLGQGVVRPLLDDQGVHETVTPMRCVEQVAVVHAEVLPTGGDADRARYHKALRKEAARLRRLVDDVLDFSRLERGQELRIQREDVALGTFAEELVADTRARVGPGPESSRLSFL